ncbi:MAG: circadian clock protein KaiC [Nitrobacter sp.]
MLSKVPSGIAGLDEITSGGLPAGRPTLVCGGPGSGKTLLGVSFLVRGALQDNEPGVLISFDEGIKDLEVNSASLGYELATLRQRKLLAIDHVHLEPHATIETGDFDLEGLFIRLTHAVDQVKARRVVLDGIDTLFAGIPNEAILRGELRRLFDWLKERGLSTVITAERGETGITRHGIEEYVSDCVIVLDTRLQDELATRRLRIVKYRGSAHGVNEYPFLIEHSGITVLPVTSLALAHTVSDTRLPSGVAGLDQMLEGKGFYKGSSILVSGGPGTGKTTVGGQFAAAACGRGERCLVYAFEESVPQMVRNMRTVGIDWQPLIDDKRLTVHSIRPSLQGLEMHLASMLHLLQTVRPEVVVVDPLSALQASGTMGQSQVMVLRLIDYLKGSGATSLFLSTQGTDEAMELNISSLMDTWIVLRNLRRDDGHERRIYIAKSRGMAHSSDVRDFAISAQGIDVVDRKAPI